MPDPRAPRLALRLLKRLLPTEHQQAVLGDMEELHRQLRAQEGALAAGLGLWAETIRSLPHFVAAAFQNPVLRRHMMSEHGLIRAGGGSAALAILFLLPALLLLGSGLVFSFGNASMVDSLPAMPAWIDSPWTVIGGLAIAAVINLAAVLKARIQSSTESFIATLEIKKSGWNLANLGLSGLAGLAILLYLIGENFGPLI